ncbi:hypothetical protein C8P66_112150 [Humitalea rosea]|uniref:Dolichyl-phosphate-mannose-protein mannosyltransferase n=1 Tax=Humitalea rosea TaxID=990373 RepID=A0A2W7IF50_9PROT|nr:hypothetical protein [Humitalea rosea]PZW45133.1 hypothetical protein C8P66_112150 [Humitalea rosea]
MKTLAVLLGGLFLLWPAALNGYPLVFTDTGGFLHQTLGPLMIWDKPWIYGPLLHLFHWRVTLWAPLLAQGVLVSWLLWLALRALGRASPLRHLGICAALAVLTTAPWSTALLMPDILVVAVVLPALLLGLGWEGLSRAERVGVFLAALLGTASHLSFLPLAAGLVVVVALLARWWPGARASGALVRTALPLLGALALLLGTNRIGHGVWSVSPHGSTFLLARLIADGPAARTIAARCPEAGWYLCAWAGRLPADSDDFLWREYSPMNRDAAGHARFLGGALLSPEARIIVGETLAREPGAVLLAVLGNGLRQLGMVRAGDTLMATDLDIALRPRLLDIPGDLATYDAGLQAQGRLPAVAEPFFWPYLPVLLLTLPLLGFGVAAAWRLGDRRPACLAVIVLAALLGNALATGGLSKPHHRYQARIVWLLPFAALVAVLPRRG